MNLKIENEEGGSLTVYDPEDDAVTRLSKCIAFELQHGGNTYAVAEAILRDVERGFISLWRPMRAAPKDGTVIFAACSEWHNSQLLWNKEYRAWEDYVDSGRFRTPIAWIPIPDLSKEEREELMDGLRKDDEE